MPSLTLPKYSFLFWIVVLVVKVQAQDPATTVEGTTESTRPALPILDENTNLISLLQQIRKLVSDGDLEKAQKLSSKALADIKVTEQNNFYLKQVRKEETKIYYAQAQKAFKDGNFSLASHLLGKYLSLIHISEPTRRYAISYAVFCLKKKT